MLEGDEVTSMGRTAVDNQTVRTVFIIRPDKRIGLFLPIQWQQEEIFRNFKSNDSVQLTANHKVATPADWKKVKMLLLFQLLKMMAKKLYPDGWDAVKPYQERFQIRLNRLVFSFTNFSQN